MKKFLNLTIFLFLAGLSLSLAPVALADAYGLSTAATEGGLSGGAADIPKYLGNFAGAALALSGSIFLFLVIYGGILILTSAGDSGKIGKGKEVIIWAVIGALILGAAYAITQLVFQVFK